MDHTKVLKRAWHILWRYRVLWVFGFILALTTTSYGSPVVNFNLGRGDFDRPLFRGTLPEDYEFPEEFDKAIEELVELFTEGIPADTVNTLIAVGIALGVFILVLIILGKLFRYISETALIRMVDNYEEMEEARPVGYGFRLGWSRTTWRLFLIDLVIDLPLALIILLLLALALTPILLWTFGEAALGVVGTVTAIGFFFLLILVGIVISVALGLFKPFFRRACALEGLGVIESIRKGYFVVRRNFKDVGIMWLIMLGIKIGWPILMIPIGLLVVILGALLGGAAALIVGTLTGLAFGGVTPWIFAAALGFPIFLIVVVLPLGFLNGLRETFFSSTWTLTYREVTSIVPLEIKAHPDPSPL